MKLKGGFAYIDMKGNIVENVVPSGEAIYVKGIYNTCLKAVKSGKIIVLYNCGGSVKNIPVLILAYNSRGDGVIMLRYIVVTPATSVYNRNLLVSNDDTYSIS